MPSRALHTPSGESCYAMDQSPETPKHIFTCPICQNPMELVTPRVTCNYFRHEVGHEHGTEPESPEHLAMKEWIVKSAREAGLSAVTEVIIQNADTVNEADVLIPELKLIYECQCSPIPTQTFVDRTLNYLRTKHEVNWILGGKLLRENLETAQIRDIEERISRLWPLRYYDGKNYFAGEHSIHFYKKEKGTFFLKRHLLSTELNCLKTGQIPPAEAIREAKADE